MTVANVVTLFRFFLAPFFVGALLYYGPEKESLRLWAVAIFASAMVSDGVDGYLARRWSQRSSLGVILDPLADKLLLMSGFILLATLGSIPERFRIPAWVSIVVVSRDVFILSGSFVIYLLTQRLEVRPSALGKVTTFFQMVTILASLLGLPFRIILYGVMVGATLLSGLGYLRDGVRLLNASHLSS